jgi:hypothetical protein
MYTGAAILLCHSQFHIRIGMPVVCGVLTPFLFILFFVQENLVVLSFAACEPEASSQEGGKVQELRHNHLYQVSGQEQLPIMLSYRTVLPPNGRLFCTNWVLSVWL